ncbi:MAG: hypothetical protein EOP46_04185 [Sphingobacteriaceae bacterium]|nr:MAG: hypothetical protein EOP46_04185 [Sphingobacteriaceae bacterium]
MDPNANNQYRFLYDLLANPAGLKIETAANLHQLVKNFPQSGILQALYAYANEGHNVSRAAATFNPLLLHKLLNSAANFNTLQPNQVFFQQETIGLKGAFVAEQPAFIEPEITHQSAGETEIIEAPVNDEAVANNETLTKEPETAEPTEVPVAEIEPQAEEAVEEEFITQENAEEEQAVAPIVEAIPEPEETVAEEPIEEIAIEVASQEIDEPIAEEVVEEPVTNEVLIEDEPVAEPPQPESEIEDEVYDEITGIEDIAIDVTQAGEPTFHEATVLTFEDPFSAEDTKQLIEDAGETSTASENTFRLNDEADKLIVGNIAATDYFMFDRAFGKIEEAGHKAQEEPEPLTKPVIAEVTQPQQEADTNEVAPYHDEKLPYSFLWWLDKTRKEHSGIYQPYSKSQLVKARRAEVLMRDDALQQQYIENIFHLTSVEQLDKSTAQNPAVEVKHKSDVIIERFIKEEPQIKPPSSEKLDTENKAKKSSEDADLGLVSETLARIYAEQMLYPKAIAVYKKLMLKFPEKSRYFADHIESLEKKKS